jgi:uncharacterized protein
MTTLGIFSDTHGYLDPTIWEHFADVDLLVHAGDIGTEHTLAQISTYKPAKIVYGNADTLELRQSMPEFQVFTVEGIKMLLIHIALSKGDLLPRVHALAKENNVNWVIFGHTHMPMFQQSTRLPGVMLVNPGAAGKQGFHKKRTMLKFTLDQGKLLAKEVVVLS